MLLSAQVNGPLTVWFGSANIPNSVSILAYMPGTIRKNTSARMNTFNPATANFFPLLRHLPCQLRWNQNSTVTPQVNQDSSRDELILSKLLKTGIALARIQTTIQKRLTLNSQIPQSSFLETGDIEIDERRPRLESDAMLGWRLDESLRESRVLMWRRKTTCR